MSSKQTIWIIYTAVLNVHHPGYWLGNFLFVSLFTAFSTHTLSVCVVWEDSLRNHELVMTDPWVAERKVQAEKEACQLGATMCSTNIAALLQGKDRRFNNILWLKFKTHWTQETPWNVTSSAGIWFKTNVLNHQGYYNWSWWVCESLLPSTNITITTTSVIWKLLWFFTG